MEPSRQQLYRALVDAFPQRAELNNMISIQLDENPDIIAAGTALTSAIVALLQWAKSRDRVRDLVIAAHDAVPTNSLVKECLALINAGSRPASPPVVVPASKIRELRDMLTKFHHSDVTSIILEVGANDYVPTNGNLIDRVNTLLEWATTVNGCGLEELKRVAETYI